MLDFLFILLNPVHQVLLPLYLFLHSLFSEQLLIECLGIAKIFLGYDFSNLLVGPLWCQWGLSLEDFLNAGQVLRRTKVSIASKAWNFIALRIIHLGILYHLVVCTSKFLDPGLPMIHFPQKLIDVIVNFSYSLFRQSSVLNDFHVFNNLSSYLLPPSFTFLHIRKLPNSG